MKDGDKKVKQRVVRNKTLQCERNEFIQLLELNVRSLYFIILILVHSPRRRLEDNIKVDLKQYVWVWTGLC